MNAGDSVPLLDLTRYDDGLKRDIARRVEEIFETGRFVMGPANDAFEKAFAKEVGAAHAVGVSSGTDAVLVSLMALGVGPGDEVVTSPFTFFASAGEVARLNAKPFRLIGWSQPGRPRTCRRTRACACRRGT